MSIETEDPFAQGDESVRRVYLAGLQNAKQADAWFGEGRYEEANSLWTTTNQVMIAMMFSESMFAAIHPREKKVSAAEAEGHAAMDSQIAALDCATGSVDESHRERSMTGDALAILAGGVVGTALALLLLKVAA